MTRQHKGRESTGPGIGGDPGTRRGGHTRREFLGTAATVAAGGAAASVLSGTAAAAEVPYVTTRGHFEIEGGWFTSDVVLTDGHSQYDYQENGSIPSGGELTVWVHGWRNDLETARSNFRNGESVLADNGYDGAVAGYTYDADTSLTEWWSAYEIAQRNGPKLAAFVSDSVESGTTVRLVGHSLGAKVIMAGVEALSDAGYSNSVESVSLLGGAVVDDECSVGGRYGPAAADAARQVDNFWMDGDRVLDWAFGLAEGDGAVGESGVEGQPPENWEDHEVDVDGHSGYDEPGSGCMDQVVAEF